MGDVGCDLFDELISTAVDAGATEAKVVDVADIVVDPRVRLKCAIPRCSCYGSHLMCPPNLPPVKEFEEALRRYDRALIIQLMADFDSSDKVGRGLTGELCERLEESTDTVHWQLKLHRMVNKLESTAFKKGFHLAAGLIGGECRLCPDCVTEKSGEPCRHPFEARPSMEAMGIDVKRTCERVGLPLSLSSSEKVRWTGLILLD
jgi:predicted metal-binding protein